jgi:hypothetical protein
MTMTAADHLSWPFFAPHHAELATTLDAWAAEHVASVHTGDADADCRALVRLLGAHGWLAHAVAGREFGGAGEAIVRATSRAWRVVRQSPPSPSRSQTPAPMWPRCSAPREQRVTSMC